jgi:hypothetical protein
MHSNSHVAQKNMIPVLLVLFCDVLCMKNICHACYVENIDVYFKCLYWLIYFMLERRNCIKHAYDNFCTVFVYCVDLEKILNLLFDTFRSTKYFHALLYPLVCHFCVGSFTYLIAMKILW